MPLQEYKCPNCGGAIEFNPGAQEMTCPFCDSVISIDAFNFMPAAQTPEEEAAIWEYEGGRWGEDEQQGLVVYSCNSCSGEIVGDRTLGAATCPFCGSTVMMTGTFSGDLRPNLMIPFRFDKQSALDSLEKHYEGKKLLPDVFREKNRINEIKGVYIPFWLYDADTNSHITYDAKKVRTWVDSRYIYTETSHYHITRSGILSFNAVPADGSETMSDVLMESIEPFNMGESTDFHTAYLAGFYANKYDLDAKQCSPRINERIKNTTAAEFAKTVTGYTGVRPISTNIRVNCRKVDYALLPVWLLGSSWDGKNFVFAMNGQTGKFVGDLPLDKKKRMRYFWTMFGAIAAGLLLLTQGYITFFM